MARLTSIGFKAKIRLLVKKKNFSGGKRERRKQKKD